MRDVVCAAVVEEEGGHAGGRGVVERCDVEFEEVEEGEGGCEEGEAPEWVGVVVQVDSEEGAGAEGQAEEGGAEGDGERRTRRVRREGGASRWEYVRWCWG